MRRPTIRQLALLALLVGALLVQPGGMGSLPAATGAALGTALPALPVSGGAGDAAGRPAAIDSGGMVRVGAVVLDAQTHSLYTGVIDDVHGYAYFGTTGPAPAYVIKVALGAGDAPPTEVASIQLPSGESHLISSVIDIANGYAYFGTTGSQIIKVALGAGDAPPVRIGTLTLPVGTQALGTGVIDTATGYAYFAAFNTTLFKVALGAGNALPTVVGTTQLEGAARRGVIDPLHGYAYFVTPERPQSHVYKVKLGAGSAPPARFGAVLTLPEANTTAAAIDPAAGYAYFGTYLTSASWPDPSPGHILKVALGAGDAAPTFVAEVATPERYYTNAVIDPAAGFAYFGNDLNYPASNIVKIALGAGNAPPVEVGSILLNHGTNTTPWTQIPVPGNATTDGEIFIQSGVIDVGHGYAYWGTDTVPGQVIKVRLGSAPVPGPATQGPPRFIPPVRVLDTRGAPFGPIGFQPGGAPFAAGALAAGSTTRVLIAGQPFGSAAGGNQITFPGDLTGLLLNVTVVSPNGTGASGFVTVFPGDQAAAPNASTLNPSTAIAHNFTATAVPTTTVSAGTIAIYTTNALDVALDVVGYFSPSNAATAGNLAFVNPVRVLDTRGQTFGGPIGVDGATGAPIAAAPLGAGETRRYRLAGQSFAGLRFPADTSAILAHVTIVQGAASGGYVTLLPGDAAGAPTTSTVNPSTAIAFNSWASAIPTGGANAGQFAIYSTNQLDVIVDVMGYYAPSNPSAVGQLSLVTPVRVVDTRAGFGGPTGFDASGNPITAQPLGAGQTRRFLLGGRTFAGFAFPSDVKGFFGNVTIVQGGASGGYVTAFPGDQAAAPNSSTVNPATAIAAAWWASGLPNAPAANPGTEAIYSTNQLDVILDITGYFR